MMIRTKLLIVLFTAIGVLRLPAAENDPISETLSGFEEAIRLGEQLSRERQTHDRLMRVLKSEIEALRAELEETKRKVSEIEAQRTKALEERERLVSRRNEQEQNLQLIGTLTQEILPILESIEEAFPPWIDRGLGPEDDSPGNLLLQLRNRWLQNRTIKTFQTEVTDPSNGDQVRVDLVGFGFGGAFFSSPDGSFGGRFVYDGKEWVAEIISGFAPGIRELIVQEEGLAEPEFIRLPVQIGEKR